MSRTSHQHSAPEPQHARITIAVITGILAGVTRALTNWLLDHLTDN